MEAPESDSVMERIYFRTVGNLSVNFFEGSVVSAAFGVLDIRVLLGGGICDSRVLPCGFAVDVGSLTAGTSCNGSAAPFGRLLMMFAAAFRWILFVTRVMPWNESTRTGVHSKLGS